LNFFTKVRTSCVDRVCIKEKIIHLRECYLWYVSSRLKRSSKIL
jgi:hypothetical protein